MNLQIRVLKCPGTRLLYANLGGGAFARLPRYYPVRQLHPSPAAEIQESRREYAKTFDKILIANRGEIACRIIRTAKKMGIKTVAIHSDADARSVHVHMADEAVNVGPAPSSQSYLNVPAIVQAIKDTGAQAVHPGYGFLSENAKFVEELGKNGIVFIGPNAKAIGAMGDKIESKIIAKNARVNTIPGYEGAIRDAEHALEIAKQIGYPIMLKASAGGGGKGMRIAREDKQVMESFKLATQESLSSFGDDRLLVEKYIDNPRHIEIQIMADKQGNVIYLPERECSIQRRNQKVIEEAPSVHLDEKTRRAMGEQATTLAKNVGYDSAGTVEFLVDPQRNFYFLEMNTRLQVEHPVTEYITGLDLVELMIRVAADQPLALRQEDVKFHGWAFESRVYAEDPEKYLPSIGRLNKYVEPVSLTSNNEVRCDSGVVEGSEISIYYDPLICKLSTYDETRDKAIQVMERALDTYVIQGVTHNIPLLREVFGTKRFQSGDISTKFLAEEYPEGFKGHLLNEESLFALACVAGVVYAKRDARNWCWGEGQVALLKGDLSGKAPKNWDVWIKVNGNNGANDVHVQIERLSDLQSIDKFKIHTQNHPVTTITTNWQLNSPLIEAHFRADNEEKDITAQYIDLLPTGFRLQFLGTKFDITVHTIRQHELSKYMITKPKQDMSKVIVSPMPGSVVSIAVKEGDIVAEGIELAIVEAMKMQNVLRAARSGKVKKIFVKPGHAVAAEEVMIEFESNDT